MDRVLVTGGAGFIGSFLVDYLVEKNIYVRVIDNLSSGKLENIKKHIGRKNFEFIQGDLKNTEIVEKIVRDIDTVFHFAANPEVRVSIVDPIIHFNENLLVTFNLLEAIRRKSSVELFVFASSSTVYGDASTIPTPEEYMVKPISIYGASKAGCEALLSAYTHIYGFKGISIRYANIVGPRLRHGVIYDFIKKLLKNPFELEILGDGSQRKSYLYISDAIEATIFLAENSREKYSVFNVGNEDWITVLEIADIVSKIMGVKPKYIFKKQVSNGRGWPGDVKYMLLDITRIKKLGWRPRYSSREAVYLTAKALYQELVRES